MSGQFAPIPMVPGIDPCPECLQGKHGNCDGTTWDIVADEPTACPCATRGHVDG